MVLLCTSDWISGQDLDGSGSGSNSDEDEIVVDLQPYLEKLKDLVLHVILHNKWKECIVFFLEGAVFDELVSSMLVQLLRTVVADLLVQQQDFKSNRQWFRQN
ncbi:uncharacterized protein LOC107842398 isoform X2 [Capsicum annuum]|uniref:uncharacterized protein LOC107842398 isoform X2 n=1 Tax=Capsicum annuum TaxID=4072 RepID=UPI001FB0F312|nr:uncharacterized protein LOC107842398 isoform X2 [Capsicum annuum]